MSCNFQESPSLKLSMTSTVGAHIQGKLEITQEQRVEVGRRTASSHKLSRARLMKSMRIVLVDWDMKKQSSPFLVFRVSPSTLYLPKLLS